MCEQLVYILLFSCKVWICRLSSAITHSSKRLILFFYWKEFSHPLPEFSHLMPCLTGFWVCSLLAFTPHYLNSCPFWSLLSRILCFSFSVHPCESDLLVHLILHCCWLLSTWLVWCKKKKKEKSLNNSRKVFRGIVWLFCFNKHNMNLLAKWFCLIISFIIYKYTRDIKL